MVKKAGATKKKSHSAKKSKVSKTKKTTHPRPITRTASEVKIEKVLVENFVSLQRVMTNLSVKFDNLSNQISKLLELFEISAKALAKKDFSLEKETKDSKKIIERLDNLSDQNKVLARGLTLLHEAPRQPSYPPPAPRMPGPPQRLSQTPGPIQEQETGTAGYQKSISLRSSSESANLKPKKFKQLPE